MHDNVFETPRCIVFVDFLKYDKKYDKKYDQKSTKNREVVL